MESSARIVSHVEGIIFFLLKGVVAMMVKGSVIMMMVMVMMIMILTMSSIRGSPSVRIVCLLGE